MDAKGDELVAQNVDGRSSRPPSPRSSRRGWRWRFWTATIASRPASTSTTSGGSTCAAAATLPDLGGAGAARDRARRDDRQGADRRLVLDASYYPSDLRIPGIEDTDEAYDALNRARGEIQHRLRRAQRRPGAFRRKQTPITPLAIAQFRRTVPRQRPHQPEPGSRGKPPICRRADRRVHRARRRQREGPISIGTAPEGLKPVYVHRQSRTLSQILVELLKRLEQLHRQPGFPGDRRAQPRRAGQPEKSLQVANEKLAAHGLAATSISRRVGHQPQQPFTARGLAKVLELFAPHADLLRGHDGGLNKTGTMDGDSHPRRLCRHLEPRRVRFVISLAGDDGEMRFRLLRAIEVRAVS